MTRNSSIYMTPEGRARATKVAEKHGIGIGKLLELLLIGTPEDEIGDIIREAKLIHMESRKAERERKRSAVKLVASLSPAQLKRLEAEHGQAK